MTETLFNNNFIEVLKYKDKKLIQSKKNTKKKKTAEKKRGKKKKHVKRYV